MYLPVLPVNTMITAMEYLFLALLTLFTGLLSAYIVYRVIQPGLQRFVADKERTIPAQMKKQLNSFMQEQLENVDLGAISGAVGGGEGLPGGLGAIGDLLGGGTGGLSDILGLLGQMGGNQGKGSSKKGKIGL